MNQYTEEKDGVVITLPVKEAAYKLAEAIHLAAMNKNWFAFKQIAQSVGAVAKKL